MSANLGRAMRLTALFVGATAALAGLGCQASTPKHADLQGIPDMEVPKELDKVTMPAYTVEAPDILRIDAQRLIPLPPYKIEPLDVLYLYDPKAPEMTPINGLYPVDPDGTINLGPIYGGNFKVADATAQEIEKALAKHLIKFNKETTPSVSLAQSKGVQQVRGEHLVRPDGTVGLGSYGSVYVAGMTLPQVKAAIEQALSQKLLRPEVSVDVGAFNSKWYYVITDFAGNGAQVVRLPITGNETALDAISQIGGLSAVSSNKMWIGRPAPAGSTKDQILPIDWKGISRRGQSRTNYQILPGDRVFIMGNPLSKVDSQVSKILSPAERIFGFSLLGYSTIRTTQTGNVGGGGGR